MEDHVKEAIEFLKDNLKDKGTIFVGFSGGKDSIVIAKLMEMSGLPYRLYHSFTGIDAPELIGFIRKEYPEAIFLKHSLTFWHMIKTKNPPANYSRWCCTELKKKASDKVPIRNRVLGIRAEESTERGKYERINHVKKLGQFLHYPILNWNEAHVWDFIEEYNLPYPKLYDQGFGRIGCVVCPYHSTKNGRGHEMYRKKWPKHFKLFEKKCHEWFDKRKGQGKEMYFDTAETFISEWYRGNVQWYKRKEKTNGKKMVSNIKTM